MADEDVSQRCQRVGCELPARWKVGAKLWALGHPKDSHPPVEMFLGVVVCDHHKDNPDGPIQEFFGPEGREMIDVQMARMAQAPLDYDSAEWKFDPLQGGA